MDTVTIRVYYDFASTLCYVAHRVLVSVESEIADFGVELEWRPIDLTMAAPWGRGDSFADEVRSAVRNTARALGIEAEMPDPWLDSRPASCVALRLETTAAEGRWRREVFSSIFEGGSAALTPSLVELARELLGPGSESLAAEDFTVVEESTREAIELGVTGVPTLLLDNWLYGGIHDGDSMLAILGRLAEQYREVGTSAVN